MRVFLFLLLALLWGGSFIAIKIAVALVPPFWAAGIRLFSAVLVLYLVFKLSKKGLELKPSAIPRVWLSGLTSQGLPFCLLFWGEKTISPGLGGILNGTSPIWTFIFGLILMRHDEPFTFKKLAGLILGVAGLFCIFGPKLALGFSNSSTLGTILVGIMAISYGLGTVINRSVMLRSDSPSLESSLFHQLLISMVFALILAFVFEGLPQKSWFLDSSFILATLYMGLLSTAFAFLAYFKLIKEWGALRASSVAYLLPLAAVLLDFLFNKTIPSLMDMVGTAIILVGIFLLQGRGLVQPPARA